MRDYELLQSTQRDSKSKSYRHKNYSNQKSSNMKLRALAATIVATATLISVANAHFSFKSRIPNGDRVPNPCSEGTFWSGVGHQSPAGANARNPFGMDFKAAGLQWTVDLCRKDSDGDGLTNGQELGDPDCVWRKNTAPARTTSLSHPGICPLDSATCKNSWTVCPKAFSCPAMNEPGVTVRNFTINETAVPPKETTYMCQAFELNNTASPVHMIGSRPIIVNKDVMHHMIIYACSEKPEQALFDGPQECFMGKKGCHEVLNLWAYGIEGECFNSNAGFRVGGVGYRYAVLELHWNNPRMSAGYKDSSGFSVYFTHNLRKYDQGTVMYGELNLVLPPRQPLITVNHTCPSVCTQKYHSETRYITSAGIHMHTYGIQGRISLWRNGTFIKDLSPLEVYDYNSPKMFMFDPPVEYRQGDEVKTECYFNTLKSNKTVFYGEGTSDEMCFSFLSYYPNNASIPAAERLAQCLATSGINYCWLRSNVVPQVERDCNITAMMSGEMPTRVADEMKSNGCFSRTGCDPVCRDYLNNTLWPTNACYDPKRSRQMAEALTALFGRFLPSSVPTSIGNTLFGQRFCEQEIKMLAEFDRKEAPAVATMPPMTPKPHTGGLASEHLLAIIIVCSCLGFVLILAAMIILAKKLNAKPSRLDMGNDVQEKANVYKVYDNEVKE